MNNITIGAYNTEEKTLCVIATFNRENTNLSEKQFISYITNIANNFANILEKDIVLVNRQDSDRVVDIDEDEKLIKISSRLKHLTESDIDLMIFNKTIPENVGKYVKDTEKSIQDMDTIEEQTTSITELESREQALINALEDIQHIIDNTL